MRHEQVDDGQVIHSFCDGQRRIAALLRPIDLRAVVQQQPRRVDVAPLAGNKQLRPTLLVRLVNIGAAVQPLLHDADVSLLRPARASLSLLVCNYL